MCSGVLKPSKALTAVAAYLVREAYGANETCPCLTASERPATGAAVQTALTYKPHDKPKSYDQHLSWQGHEGNLRGAARDNILRFFISMSYYCLLFIKDNKWFLRLLKRTTWEQFQCYI